MAKTIKFVNLLILFIFTFLVVADASATTRCVRNSDCRHHICMYPLVPRCKYPLCRCV
ncbi:putative Late nodulin [Medicago truncatula]|uniref:Late nodulin n=1 Tax=Medicago truncatula TaxID=3880 RepID=G7JN36_MEDTR|nr:late nodulin [Medicago truncatula]RHN58798.1 putative Late nodulin [Medicago truncatula]